MDPDVVLTIGVLLLIPTIPMIINGIKEMEAPKFAFIMTLISFGCIAYAFSMRPGAYPINEIPNIMMSVINRYL